MKNTKQLKPIPEFNTAEEEAKFWMDHDTTEYMDWSQAAVGIFPNLKKTTKLISLRLPASIINKAKAKANKMDIPYQSMLKEIIYQGVSEDIPRYKAISPKNQKKKKSK